MEVALSYTIDRIDGILRKTSIDGGEEELCNVME